jgi:hypothetical protein
LLHEEKKLHLVATESKHWHSRLERFAEIRTALLVETFFVEYQFASQESSEAWK